MAGAVTGLQGESAEPGACSQIASPVAWEQMLSSRRAGSSGIVWWGEAAALSGGLQTKPHCSGNKIFYIFINITRFGFRGWWWLWSLLSVGISWAVMKAGKVNSPLTCPSAPQLWP